MLKEFDKFRLPLHIEKKDYSLYMVRDIHGNDIPMSFGEIDLLIEILKSKRISKDAK